MICKMCLQDKKLVKAHIIPRAFFEYMRPRESKNEPFDVLIDTESKRNTISRIGIYDPNILCRECENLFQKYDDYGQKILLKTKFNKIKTVKSGVVGWKLDNFDYKKLKLFFLGVLWRASISKQTKRCEIGGKYESLIKNILKGNNLDNDNFDCFLLRHDDYFGQSYLLDPISKIKFKDSSINFANIYLGAGYKLFIKVDQRSLLRDILFNIVLKKDKPLFILKDKNFIYSKEWQVLRNLI